MRPKARAGDRTSGRLHRHLRPRSHQPGDGHRRRLHGFGPDGGDHRTVASKAIGTDAFQEADIRGITFPVTKHSFLVTDPIDIPHAIAAAFHLASTGRPGPVLVDIAKDALASRTEYVWPSELDLPGYVR